jgi:diguanylate cyclase (GGDEF)-like protein
MDSQTEIERERAAYAAAIRRQNERLAFGVVAFLMLTAPLPVTRESDRVGVFVCALSFFVLCIVWFRIVPASAFGQLRVVVFGIFAQPCVVVLLVLTGGLQSEYFPFALLLVTTTVFAPRASHTAMVAAAAIVGLVGIALLLPSRELVADLGTRSLEVVGFAGFAAIVGRTLRASRSAIAARADELNDLRGRAETLSLTDTLTGLYNRRFADDTLTRLIADAHRGRAFSVAAFDLDGLKRVNDSLGHAAGDDVIIKFSRLAHAGLRGGDVAIRMGGDEFLVLLPGTGLEQATLIGDRVRAAVRDAKWGTPGAMVTVSCGVAEWRDGQSADDVLQIADRSLYEAKRAQQALVPAPR